LEIADVKQFKINLQFAICYSQILISLVPPHLCHVFLDGLFFVFFADEEHIGGVNDDGIIEALEHYEFFFGRGYHAAGGIDNNYIIAGNGIA
jgi:hypothetical protein